MGFSRERQLETKYPYLWLDAIYLKVRQNHLVVSMAVVIAIGVRGTGEGEVLDFEFGASESKTFWVAFPRRLIHGGLHGV